MATRDYLSEYLERAPVALALLRAIECRELADLPFEHPMLDMGCGDGLFGHILFGGGVEVGLDCSASELCTASRRGVYGALVRAKIARIPFADRSFATVFSNGVLEHVHDLDEGLREVHRVLTAGGKLIFTVPTMEDGLQLSGATLLRHLGFPALAQRYADAYNHIFKQVNVWPLETWRQHLEENGLTLLRARHYAAPGVFRWHDILLPAAFPSFVYKALTGEWSPFPKLRRVTIAPLWSKLMRKLYCDSESTVCSLLMVAQR